METQITAERKGRKWEATGTIDGVSRSLAPNGTITRTAKATIAEDAIDAVHDALSLAAAEDAAQASIERAQQTAELVRTNARRKVEARREQREAAASTVTQTVTV